MTRRLVRLVPGLVVLTAVAVVSRVVGAETPLNPLVVAIGSGVALAATGVLPLWTRPGIDTHKLLLETGIVLLGARLSLDRLADSGLVVAGLVAVVVVAGVAFSELLGRFVGVERETRPLLTAGACICGVSAVVAVAGSIDSKEADISYAAATILLFDAVTLVVVPVLGSVVGLSDQSFGVWAGLIMFSTGPTAAAGFVVSETAGRWATVTKLVRNAFIGVFAVGYAFRYATKTGGGDTASVDVGELWTRFPKFLIGFCIVAVVVGTGAVGASTQATAVTASDWLFTLAFVGLGFDLDLDRLRSVGLRPLLVVGFHLVAVGLLAFGLVSVFL